MSPPKAHTPELPGRLLGEPLVVRRLQRLAVMLGLAAILGATVIGILAYRVSRERLIESCFDETRRGAVSNAEYFDSIESSELPSEAFEKVLAHFEEDKAWPGSYVCVVDEAGLIAFHSVDPAMIGLDVGTMPFRPRTFAEDAPENLNQLLRTGQSWDGKYESIEAGVQLAAFTYVPGRRALLTVHVPWADIERRISATTRPWAIGFGVTVLLAVPLALWGLSKAFAESERAASRAREAERRAAENVRALREIDRAILAGGTIREIVLAAFTSMRELTPFDRASVTLIEEGQDVGRLLAVQSNVATELVEDVPVPVSVVSAAAFEGLCAGRMNVVPDLEVGHPDPPEFLKRLRAEGIRSFVNVPMLCRGKLLGTLNLGFDHVGQPPEEALEVAREIADVLALAVHQAALHEELLRQASELEKRVAERTRQLSEVNAELEGYVHSVSHDLRAPLRAVHGFGKMLQEEVAGRLGPTEREYLDRMVSASERMDALMRDLLAYSRLAREDMAVRRLDSRHVVEEAQDLLKLDLDERRARIEVVEPMLPVLGHHSSLVQALTNLLSNAAKFVAPGVEPRIRVWTEARGSRVRLWVEDNGIGIASEHQENIFRVFERLNGVQIYPGTGIGLAIVRRAVDRVGGTAGVESSPGAGSRFWIELPGSKMPA